VKVLGAHYMRFLRRLVGGDPRHPTIAGAAGVEVPIIDPSIYIERFSRKLQLGNSHRKVQHTAVRLIQYMHRDWICLGRRPNGLCGAALLIASCYHGLQVTAKDISEVVRMGEVTLRQRLTELRSTPLASMSRIEFEQAAIESTQPSTPNGNSTSLAVMPPCMRRSKRKEELKAIADKEADREQELGRALLDGRAAELKALTDGKADHESMPPPKTIPKKGKRKAAGAVGEEGPLVPLPPAERARAEKFTQREPSSDDIENMAGDIASHLKIEGILQGNTLEVATEAKAQEAVALAAKTASGEAGTGAAAIASGATASSSDNFAAAAERIGELVSKPQPIVPVDSEKGPDAQADPGGGAKPLENLSLEGSAAEGSGDEEETLSDVDDEELDAYLLDREERKDKSDIWHEVNKDYLEEWHVRGRESKRRKTVSGASGSEAGGGRGPGASASDAESSSEFGSSGRGSKSKSGSWRPRAASCTESAVLALAKKGKVSSNRINIEALESLFS